MTIACTFPGKFGDLLWALPTVRAINETFDEPVNLIVSRMLAPIVPLLDQQPYIQIARAFEPWDVQMTAPISPRVPPTEFNFDRIFHLGYTGWPLLDLPSETYQTAQLAAGDTALRPLDLRRPWITTSAPQPPSLLNNGLVVGFTDEWFELKYGICELLHQRGINPWTLYPEGSRWDREGGWPTGGHKSWLDCAIAIRGAAVFLGCCSALHVLSCAMGIPTVVMEPNPHRHHPIFWPEAVRDRVHPVIGGDGKLTHDARHTRDLVEKFLHTSPMYS